MSMKYQYFSVFIKAFLYLLNKKITKKDKKGLYFGQLCRLTLRFYEKFIPKLFGTFVRWKGSAKFHS